MKKDFVSFVVPVFNEEENIEKIANRLVQVGRKKFYEFEVILVNDNSTDNTYAIMQKLKKKFKEVEVLSRADSSKGMCYALVDGTRKAKGSIVVWTMADLSDDVLTYPKLVEKINKGFDLVVASRWIDGGSRGTLGKGKAFLSKNCSAFYRLVFGLPVHDLTNAFRAFRKEIFDAVQLESGDFAISPEFAIKAHKKGFQVGEVPTTYTDRYAGKSKFSFAKMGLRYFSLLKYRFY